MMRRFGMQEIGKTLFEGNCFGFRYAISTEHYLSAQAGAEMFQKGGNAFDAAVAATFVEGVVNPHMFTIGGECPMVLYVAKEKRVVSVNGNTEAPARANIEEYKRRGLRLIPPEGVLAAGVPAAFSALLEVLIRYGTLPFEIIIGPALRLAENGFPAHDGLLFMPGFSIQANLEKFLEMWPASAKFLLEPDKSVPAIGSCMKNPALAGLFRALCAESKRAEKDGRTAALKAALDMFYRGDVAREIESFVRERNGYLNREDLAQFQTLFEEPVSAQFRGAEVFKCGPWSQGPVFLQLLRLLDGFHLEKLKHNSGDYLHLWIEAAKLAYADREQYYGDPRCIDVPMDRLLSEEYNRKRRQLIDPQNASGLHRPGNPRKGDALLSADEVFSWKSWGFGTVHVACADEAGNLAALTPSGGWISGNEVIPTLGFPLTTRLQTFYLDPAHPNALAPRKRPRTTLTPSLAFLHGRPWMAFGTMGGDQQDQWLNQFFLNCIVFDMSTQQAIEAPKITFDHTPGTFYPHDAFPKRVRLERRISSTTFDDLARRGHEVEFDPAWSMGFICTVSRTQNGLLEAGSDPRGKKSSVFPSCALAW